jgi:hypothetical protein
VYNRHIVLAVAGVLALLLVLGLCVVGGMVMRGWSRMQSGATAIE